MQVRDFLVRAHLSTGFNQNYMQRLVTFLKKTHHLPNQEEMELIISKMSPQKQVRFLTEFYGFESQKRSAENRQFAPFVTIFDDNYPTLLKESNQAPAVLFYRGNLSLTESFSLGVVGARQATSYGKQSLEELLPTVVAAKITTVSGLARGIDGLAHQITLDCGGQTIAVIGTGLDGYYPRQNARLQEMVAQKGLLLSEYGLGTPSLPYHFPQRNRIIAGLSQTLLVVEAQKRSGSLITANMAADDNRTVLAIPGQITTGNSDGCNELILAGAKPILSAKDILEEYQNW